jgi:hypothetical protein
VRFYSIEFRNAQTGRLMLPSSLGGLGFSSLLPNGQINPAALNIELDLPVAPFHAPAGNAWLRIWGLSLKDIGSAYDLNGAEVRIIAGMSKGLPLANPAQARLIMRGKVLQGIGNWVGVDQTIDTIFYPFTGSATAPLNFVMYWPTGTTLASALSVTLSTALPTAKQDINISPRLVLAHDEAGYYATLSQLSDVIHGISRSIITDAGYPGVSIAYDGTTIRVRDFLGPSSPAKAIEFQDLLGQPTFVDAGVIQIKTVLRGDINYGDLVSLPPSLVTHTQGALTGFSGIDRNKLTFSGNFNVVGMHHFGNFRQPDSASWNTTFNLIPEQKAT